jgi:diguanylate cyclase (GGDEF)-like protein
LLSPSTTQPLTDASSIQYLYLATFSFSVVGLSLGFILMVGKRLQIRLEQAATRDGLTGIALRSAFEDTAAAELAKSIKTGRMPSLLMIDLDDFKRINDRHGHRGGDAVLKEFVRRTAQVLRSNDLFGRYGGEEFVVLLPATDHAAALQVASRICEAVRAPGTDGNDTTPAFTASIGVTSALVPGGEVHTLFDQADRALYRAKATGKNRVETYADCLASEYAA